jgi:putative FmdB family regulatory protein
MPAYEHRCSPCGTTVTVQAPISERDDAIRCASCDQVMRRVYGGHAVIRVPKPLSR